LRPNAISPPSKMTDDKNVKCAANCECTCTTNLFYHLMHCRCKHTLHRTIILVIIVSRTYTLADRPSRQEKHSAVHSVRTPDHQGHCYGVISGFDQLCPLGSALCPLTLWPSALWDLALWALPSGFRGLARVATRSASDQTSNLHVNAYITLAPSIVQVHLLIVTKNNKACKEPRWEETTLLESLLICLFA